MTFVGWKLECEAVDNTMRSKALLSNAIPLLMNHRRILRHLLFWGIFFGMSLFNVLYMSSSFSQHPGWNLLWRLTGSQVVIYLVKVVVVYYSIYSIIPRWIKDQKHIEQENFSRRFAYNRKASLKYFLEFIVVVLAGTLFVRILTHLVIWPHILMEASRSFTFNSLLARYIYSLFDLIPIALGAVAIKLVQLRVNALKHESTMIEEKLNTELQFLKSQTNPHFLFNSLNNIYGLSRKQDPNTPEAILNLSKILRYMLYQSSPKTNPIRDELQLISDYIALQKLRFQEHLNITFHQEIGDEDRGVSPLLLLPLVENAFKHSNDLHTNIQIEVTLQNDQLRFKVSNSIPPDQEISILPQEGIGLANIRRQLAIIYQEYHFEANRNESTFEVFLSINLDSSVYA